MRFFNPHQGRSQTKTQQFFNQINDIIDWGPIEDLLVESDQSGKKQRGQKADHPMVLLKMQLISVWFHLSDVRTEEFMKDSIRFTAFCGLDMEDAVPDHSTLSRFRSELTAKKLYQKIMDEVNRQLTEKAVIIQGTAVVDASITTSPLTPKSQPKKMAQDRKEDEREEPELQAEDRDHEQQEEERPHADHEARWFKKRKKTYYGYKRHIATTEKGLILGVHTVTANEHDRQGLQPLMEGLSVEERQRVLADKGYQSKENDQFLEAMGSESLVMEKGDRHKPFTKPQKERNKAISKERWVVEQTFGGLARWFHGQVTRLKGLEKVHHQPVLESIAYH
ncbi:MAG: IS5 family transposase [Flavobacteriaceae bacterium]|nr:IS5 family transposase [Flavobacteriaceae bacterium]